MHLFTRTSLAPTPDKGAVFHLLTNAPVSAEVVRIASNPDSDGNYYRSAVFELANFPPFRFSAQINGQGTIVEGDAPETVENVMLDYMPNQDVFIDIDVTSFKSRTRGDADTGILPDSEQVSVDPFGTAFDIYIDAPMLKLDETDELVIAKKLERHPTVEGRFVYHVDASREAERVYGNASAASVDSKAASQAGERKRLAFKTKSVVTAGDVIISSDESKVVFRKKTFRIQNLLILSFRTIQQHSPLPSKRFELTIVISK